MGSLNNSIGEGVNSHGNLHFESESMSIRHKLAGTAARLKRAGCETPSLDARVLLCHVLGLDWAELVLKADVLINQTNAAHFDRLSARRARGEPLAYLVGKREFWSLDFEVDQSTLIPRPDSEAVVEAVLGELRQRPGLEAMPHKLLDLGTGSGCLLLSLLSELPNAYGVGTDVNGNALNVARRNAAKFGLDHRVAFYCSSWGNDIQDHFNIIVANPPYIPDRELLDLPRDVFQFEPRIALCGGQDGLDAYRQMAKDVPRLLLPGGLFVVEIAQGRASQARRVLFDRDELIFLKSHLDLAGTVRVLVGKKSNIEKGWNKRSAALTLP